MVKTMADVVKEEGRLREARSTLLRQLHIRFRDVPKEPAGIIEDADDINQLNAWLERVPVSDSLTGIQILPSPACESRRDRQRKRNRIRSETLALTNRMKSLLDGDMRNHVVEFGNRLDEELDNIGRVDQARWTLRRQLCIRFGRVPQEMENVLRKIEDLDRLREWLDRVLVVSRPEDVGIEFGDLGSPVDRALEKFARRSGRVALEQYALLRLFQVRFRDVPEKIVDTVIETDDLDLLSEWQTSASTSLCLGDIPIGKKRFGHDHHSD